ncbi:hypothetical protein Bca52824_067447 [Brassica carinata]|uniref:Uncharacterized protein n=1 Tax=Brassica carinata TaxID=52824 RepID=A0A8X7QNQ6_BRACI|nr:hypothetical protein Bca52824_067447 [Brassica carinata]
MVNLTNIQLTIKRRSRGRERRQWTSLPLRLNTDGFQIELSKTTLLWESKPAEQPSSVYLQHNASVRGVLRPLTPVPKKKTWIPTNPSRRNRDWSSPSHQSTGHERRSR